MKNIIASSFLRSLLLSIIITIAAGCSFSGTEVGNGNKPRPTDTDKRDRSNKAKTEADPIAKASNDDEDTNEEGSQEGADRILSSEGDTGMSKASTQAPGSAGNIAIIPPDIFLTLMITNCASPFSHNLVSPIRLLGSQASDPSTVTTIRAELINPAWNVWRQEGSTDDRFSVQSQITSNLPYGVTAADKNGAQVGNDLTCSDFSMDQNARLEGRSETFKRVAGRISMASEAYIVSWYLKPTQVNSRYTLEQYEVRNGQGDELIKFRAQ